MTELVEELKKQNKDVVMINSDLVQHKVNAHHALDTQMETIFSLAKLAQSRDDDTGEHLTRVQSYCRILSEELAKNSPYSNLIDNSFITDIVNASTLHDIGKVGISDLILLKNARLTDDEFEIMKTHTIIGAQTLEDVHSKFGDNSFIKMGKIIARSHHERWDGKGYPDGLSGEHIPLPARIMAIADVYDALSTKRVYKEAFPQEKCVQIIKDGRGTQFDPFIVDAFLNVADKFYEVRVKFADLNS
jgi:putative two-component system response regulator